MCYFPCVTCFDSAKLLLATPELWWHISIPRYTGLVTRLFCLIRCSKLYRETTCLHFRRSPKFNLIEFATSYLLMSDLKMQQLLEEWGLPGLINTFKGKSNPNLTLIVHLIKNIHLSFFTFILGLKSIWQSLAKWLLKILPESVQKILTM